MKKLKRLYIILKKSGGTKLIFTTFLIILIASILLYLFDPNIKTIQDGLWYCYISSTTIGFGDIYAKSLIGRIITVIVSINGILVTAVITGVVVTYYTEYIKDRQNESISMFLEKLENLPNLSKKELEEISEKVKKIG